MAGSGLMRVTLANSDVFSQVGMNNTLKSFLVKDGVTMKDATQLLIPKITRGMTLENRQKVEEEAINYHFYARHQALKTLSKIDPNDEALDWIPNGKKGHLFTVEFRPSAGEADPEPTPGPTHGSRRYTISKMAPMDLKATDVISPFGCHIMHITFKDGRGEWVLPQLVEQTTDYIRQNGLSQEGVFRISASSGELDKAKQECDEGLPITLAGGPDSVTLCCALLKVFLRELVEPLCTWGFYEPAIAIQRLSIPDETKVRYYNWLLHMLPEPNLTCLKKILDLLIPIEANSEVNKMTAVNLAVVIGPSICKLENGDMMTEMSDMGDLNQLFALIISNAEKVMRYPLEPKYTMCISGHETGPNLGIDSSDFAFLRAEGDGYQGLNLTNGATGFVAKQAIQTTHLDSTVVPVPPPMARQRDKEKEKDKDKEKEGRRKERKQAKMAKEEEERHKKEEERQKKKLHEEEKIRKKGLKALEKAKSKETPEDVLREQLMDQIRTVTNLTHDMHRLSCIVHDLSRELNDAVKEVERLKGSPYVPPPPDRISKDQVGIIDSVKDALKITPEVPFPRETVISVLGDHFGRISPTYSSYATQPPAHSYSPSQPPSQPPAHLPPAQAPSLPPSLPTPILSAPPPTAKRKSFAPMGTPVLPVSMPTPVLTPVPTPAPASAPAPAPASPSNPPPKFIKPSASSPNLAQVMPLGTGAQPPHPLRTLPSCSSGQIVRRPPPPRNPAPTGPPPGAGPGANPNLQISPRRAGNPRPTSQGPMVRPPSLGGGKPPLPNPVARGPPGTSTPPNGAMTDQPFIAPGTGTRPAKRGRGIRVGNPSLYRG